MSEQSEHHAVRPLPVVQPEGEAYEGNSAVSAETHCLGCGGRIDVCREAYALHGDAIYHIDCWQKAPALGGPMESTPTQAPSARSLSDKADTARETLQYRDCYANPPVWKVKLWHQRLAATQRNTTSAPAPGLHNGISHPHLVVIADHLL